MNKHAFLVIAHKDDYTLETLLTLLDHPNNDIFLHMDLKNDEFKELKYKKKLKHSDLISIPRINISWGGYTQIKAEIALLEVALKRKVDYKYYHLLSGEDLPIKSMPFIHDFYEQNFPKNFVRFEKETFTYTNRVRFYYPLQDLLGRNRFNKIFNKLSIPIQRLLNIKRNTEIEFQKGTQWFSITEQLVKYILERKVWIEDTFKNTLCGDEIFLQTLIHSSEFRNTLFHKKYDNDLKAIMRYIDWDRGNPYIFKLSDFDELIKSPYLFARKFNSEIDKDIIEKIKDFSINNN